MAQATRLRVTAELFPNRCNYRDEEQTVAMWDFTFRGAELFSAGPTITFDAKPEELAEVESFIPSHQACITRIDFIYSL